MALTVADLVSDPRLGLVLRAGASPAAMDRAIYWSHPTELMDPHLFTEHNEIIITTGAMIPRLTRSNSRRVEEAATTFVDNITNARVCALAFGTRLVHRNIPESVLEQASRHDLPVIEIPLEIPFSWVTNAVAAGIESDKRIRSIRSTIIKAILEGDTKSYATLVRPVWGCEMPDDPLRVMLVEGVEEELNAIAADLSVIHPERAENRIFGHGSEGLWIIVSDDGHRRTVARVMERHAVGIGISDICRFGVIVKARQQAAKAANMATSPMGGYRYFDATADSADLRPVVYGIDQEAAAAIVTALERQRGDLLPTLSVWLSHLCNDEQSARALGVHRHTLARRLRQIETILGRALDDPQTRAELWFVVKRPLS